MELRFFVFLFLVLGNVCGPRILQINNNRFGPSNCAFNFSMHHESNKQDVSKRFTCSRI